MRLLILTAYEQGCLLVKHQALLVGIDRPVEDTNPLEIY